MRQRRLRSVRFRSRRLAPVLIGLCLAQPLSGCFIDTEHPDPELETADKYKYGPRQPYLELPALDWWRNFQSAELTKLMELAQTANLDIAVAVAQIIQADAQVRVSGAPLLPNITANFINTRDRTSPASIAPSTTTTVRRGSLISDLHTANLSASYVLDFWGQTRATVLANEELAIASRFNREVVAITTEVAVADAYFQVLGAQDRLRIANNNLREANRVLQVIRERLAAGTASQLEIAQQESLVGQVRANIPPLVITEQQNRVALAVLVGRAPENFAVRGGNMYAVTIPRSYSGSAVRHSQSAARHPPSRSAACLGKPQCRIGARRILSDYPADWPERPAKSGIGGAVHPGGVVLDLDGRRCTAGVRRLPAPGPTRA